ncbi:MAG: protease modulator HflC [Methylobacteriaceae bacterium]|jgi:membrane protease subunit HflC|nr:protease modulator HflC [Methylobacteriaceae bacterium]
MNRSLLSFLFLPVLALAGAGLYLSVFTVYQTQSALVLRFNKLQATIDEPGLHFKVPFIDRVEFFDRRVLDVDLPAQTLLSVDKKNLEVDAFLRYRIANTYPYLQKTTNSDRVATDLLTNYTNAATLNVLANSLRETIVRTGRGRLMEDIQEQVRRNAEEMGVELIDLRLTRVNLPEVNLQQVYERMKSERQKEATDIEARGRQAAVELVAAAERDARIIVAEAEKESETIRGQGDAEYSRILAEANNADPDFYSFYRSLQAYEAGLANQSTNWVMNPKSEFFDFLQNKRGVTGK